MNQESTSYQFARIKRRYQWLRGTEVLLWCMAIGLLAFYLCNAISIAPTLGAGIALILLSIAFLVGSRRVNLFTIREQDFALYLNRHYPVLQESVDLLLTQDEDLPGLQRLQKQKTIQRFGAIYTTIKLPHQLGRAIGVFSLSVAVSAALTAFSNQREEKATLSKEVTAVVKGNLPVDIKSSRITIYPPAYTLISNQSSKGFNLKIPEGSKVEWDITFEEGVLNPLMIFSGGDTVKLPTLGMEHKISRVFTSSGFYQLVWSNPDRSRRYSDYYEIEVSKDHSPILSVENLNQFVVLNEKDNLKINLRTTLTDDYGLRRAHIIATVSKGSGEAIKFREEKLSFDSSLRISGKKMQAVKVLDLLQLGLQPGDELYFYLEAEDNKTPTGNYARTETYFIELQDTTSILTALETGLGVDLMPDYFRSQRQIIIDSEKLLREEVRITKQNFNARSNDLAHDQKVLRLRYGEFLGEEFQSSVGPQNPITPEQAEDVEKTFGHAHDTENEHNQVDEKIADENRAHSHGESPPKKMVSPMDDFVHAHEGEEEATFFIQSIKAKLKAAVTIMWDAELYLRLYQPEKSLPYQYQALILLKEISQDSRIYVHRTGFDPPPLKEEKRLTAELKEIRNSISEAETGIVKQYPNIRTALTHLEKLQELDSAVLTPALKELLTKAGQELAEIELKRPGGYLKTLSLLNSVIHDEATSKEQKRRLLKIHEVFWKVLPKETITPLSRSSATHDLDIQFLKNLEPSNP